MRSFYTDEFNEIERGSRDVIMRLCWPYFTIINYFTRFPNAERQRRGKSTLKAKLTARVLVVKRYKRMIVFDTIQTQTETVVLKNI